MWDLVVNNFFLYVIFFIVGLVNIKRLYRLCLVVCIFSICISIILWFCLGVVRGVSFFRFYKYWECD